jgi:hypothetical protein
VNLAPLDHYVLYFPGTGRYLAPAEPYYRYPEIPYTMIATKGVFCRTNPESEFNIGKEVTEAEAIIRTIDPMSIADTRENLNADVKLDSELNAGIALNYSYTGYSASDKRSTLAKASAKAREDYIKDLVGFDVDNKPELLVKYNTQNEGFNDVYKKKPFILTAEVRDPSLVEKAGEKYLVMLGSVVGSQKNMYTRDERILPVDIDYPHTTVRTVTLTIPEGYKILNPESLRIHSEHDDIDNGNTTASFHSDYQLNGNKLVVTITESYTRLHYPVAEYDRFKQVINAAADFNKVALVMEKDKKFFAKKKHKTAVSTAKAKAGAKTTVAKVAAPKAAAAKTTTVKTVSVKAATPAKPAKAAKPTEKPGGNVMRQL